MSPLQEVHTGFTFNFDGSKLAAIQRGVGKASTRLNTIAAKTEVFSQKMGGFLSRAKQVVGVYLGFRIIRSITTDYATSADAVAKFSTALGLSTERYQGLIHAVKLGGTDTMNLNNALGQLSKRALEAGQGLSTNVRAFRALGVEWNDAKGNLKAADQLFLDVADGLVNLEDKEKRTGLAMQLLGRSGKTLLPTLLLGSKAIREQIVEAKKLGNVLSKEQLQAAEKFNDEMLRVKEILSGVRNIIASKLLPALTAQLTAFKEWWIEGRNAERALRALKLVAIFTAIVIARLVGASVIRNIKLFVQGLWAGVQALRAMGVAGAATAIKIWAIVAAFAIVALAIEDLIGFAQGKDSVIGRLLGDTKIAKDLRDSLIEFGTAIKKAWKDLVPVLLKAWTDLRPEIMKLWKVIRPLIGPTFRAWIKFITFAFKVWGAAIGFVSTSLQLVISTVSFLASAASAAAEAVTIAWEDASDFIADAWEDLKKTITGVADAMGIDLSGAAALVGKAWDIAFGGIIKTLDKVISGAKTALLWLGAVTGLTKQSSALAAGITATIEAASKVQPVAALPGGFAPAGGLFGIGPAAPAVTGRAGLGVGPTSIGASAGGLQQTISTAVEAGAVSVTVNVPSGDAELIAIAINAALPPAISKVFTKAHRDLVKPPRGQR